MQVYPGNIRIGLYERDSNNEFVKDDKGEPVFDKDNSISISLENSEDEIAEKIATEIFDLNLGMDTNIKVGDTFAKVSNDQHRSRVISNLLTNAIMDDPINCYFGYNMVDTEKRQEVKAENNHKRQSLTQGTEVDRFTLEYYNNAKNNIDQRILQSFDIKVMKDNNGTIAFYKVTQNGSLNKVGIDRSNSKLYYYARAMYEMRQAEKDLKEGEFTVTKGLNDTTYKCQKNEKAQYISFEKDGETIKMIVIDVYTRNQNGNNQKTIVVYNETTHVFSVIEAQSATKQHYMKYLEYANIFDHGSNLTPGDASKLGEWGKSYKERAKELVEKGVMEEGWYNVNGREAVILNINGVKVPFYKSSQGTDGKKAGHWYPFFGLGLGKNTPSSAGTLENNWLIKGDIADMENGYGLQELKDSMDMLDKLFPWEPDSMHSRDNHHVFGKGKTNLNRAVLGKDDSGVQNGKNANEHIDDFLKRIKAGRKEDKSVTEQLIDNLSSAGITVHGKEEAEKFLEDYINAYRNDPETNKDWGAQFARRNENDNEKFNRELETLTEENANSKQFNLGIPSPILQSAGIADKPMVLYGNKIVKKAKKHGFSIQDLKGLPNAIQNPIAIFAGTDAGSHAILTKLKIGDQNVLVALSVGKNNMVDFNIIRSVYNKESKGIIDWINNGKLLYADKEKALDYLLTSAPIADKPDSQELSNATNIVKDFENPKLPEEKSSTNSDIRFMKADNGEVLGFEYNGEIFLLSDDPSVLAHEYTHVWDKAVRRRRPELWKQGVSLMKQTKLWQQVENEEAYGKKWKAEGKTAAEIENLIASEVHSRLVGEEGARIIDEQKGDGKGIVAKLKKWINDTWKALAQTFGTWTQEDIDRLTIDDFNHMTIRDFVDGTKLNEQKKVTVKQVEHWLPLVGYASHTCRLMEYKVS